MILRAAALAAAAIVLAGCGAEDRQSRIQAAQAAVDPPALWLAQADDAGKQQLYVCADSVMRDGFRRANAEINGRACSPFKDGVDRPGLYATRCELDGRRFGLTVTQDGDPQRDFTVRFALAALDGSGVQATQARRFRKVGACPAGWGIGDQARPGGRPGVNALSGTWGA